MPDNRTENSGNSSFSRIRALGPGIMAASAAIGGSHLVSSTQAGALYGWALIGFILIINFFKYPFFRAGPAWVMATGEELLAGYAKLGKGWVWLAWALMSYGGFTSVAACCVFSAGILHFMFPAVSMPVCSILVMASSAAVVLIGRFKLLSQLSKLLVSLLSFVTVIAVCILLVSSNAGGENFVSAVNSRPEVSPWTLASLGFLVMLAGWMPCPLDLTLIQSSWIRRQKEIIPLNREQAFFDFNLGFAVTALLAAVFCALGALVMFSAGVKPVMQGGGFTSQLIGLYAESIGRWSTPFMSVMALACIWGSTITVMDGYARVSAVAQLYIKGTPEASYRPAMIFWIAFECIAGLALIFFFKNEMLALLKFAMICAFCTTPVLAAVNFRLMTGNYLPEKFRYGPLLKAWSWAGLVFLIGFFAVFAVWFF